MDPETYQQAVRGGVEESARSVAALGWVVFGVFAAIAAGCVVFVVRDRIFGALNALLALDWAEPLSRISESVPAVVRPLRWLLALRPPSVLLAAVTVGIGVLLNAFHLSEARGRVYGGRLYRRYWFVTPGAIAAALGAPNAIRPSGRRNRSKRNARPPRSV